jgi:hypothetical protein
MKKITNEELVAVAEGVADALVERRVLAAALTDSRIKQRLDFLRAIDQDQEPLELSELPISRVQALKESMAITARRVGREFQERVGASESVPRDDWQQSLGTRLRHVLAIVPRRLTLPCFAPALAASEPSLQVQRESLEADSVRIEVHQLPETPPRVRFYADASGSQEFHADETSGIALAFCEAGTRELWIEIVPLNTEGRGVLERLAPAVRGSVELVGVALVTK